MNIFISFILFFNEFTIIKRVTQLQTNSKNFFQVLDSVYNPILKQEPFEGKKRLTTH